MADLKITITATDKGATATVKDIERAFDSSLGTVQDEIRKVGQIFDDVGTDIIKTMEDAAEKTAQAFADAADDAEDSGNALGDALTSGVSVGLKGLGSVVSMAFSGIVSLVGSVLSGLTSVVTGAFRFAFESAMSVVSGVVSGIVDVIGFAFKGLGTVLDTVLLAPFRFVFNKITLLAGGVGSAIGFKIAAGLQDSMTVATALIADQMTDGLRRDLSRSAEDMRAELGASGELIGRTFYNAISAGAKDAPEPLVKAAVQFGVIGGQAEAADIALTLFAQTLNTLGKDMSDVTEVADLYQKTITEGILRPSDLALGMGRLLPFFGTLNADFREMLGIIAQMSKTFPAEQLFTGLQNTLAKLIDPSFSKTLVDELGVSLKDASGHYRSVFEILKDIADANVGEDVFNSLFPDIRSAKFVLALREQTDKVQESIDRMKEAPGSIARAWEERGRSVQLAAEKTFGGVGNIFSTVLSAFSDDIVSLFDRISIVLANINSKLREMVDAGDFDRMKEAAAGFAARLADALPTLDQLKAGFATVADAGVKAWRVIAGEFGSDNSLFILSARWAFEKVKQIGAEAIEFIGDTISGLGDSQFVRAVGDRLSLLFEIVGTKFQVMLDVNKAKLDRWLQERAIILTSMDTYLPTLGEDLRVEKIKQTYMQLNREIERIQEQSAARQAEIIGRIAGGEGVTPFPTAITKPFEASDMAAIEAAIRAEIARRTSGAEGTVAGITGGAASIVRPIVDAVVQITDTQEEAAAESVDATSQFREQVSAKMASLNESYQNVVHELTEAKIEQVQYMEENGELSKDIINRVLELQIELRAYRDELRGLRASLEAVR